MTVKGYLRHNSICGDMINVSNEHLGNLKQRVILNSHGSYWASCSRLPLWVGYFYGLVQ